MNLTATGYLIIFVIGCIFQAGGFWYVTRENARRMRNFEDKLTAGLLDIAWIKGYMAKSGNGGKRR